MAGKSQFASTSALTSAHQHGPTVIGAEGASTVTIPHRGFLLDAEFHRAGPDLVLVGQDGREVVVTGYFAQGRPPALSTPTGEVIQPELAAKLAGPLAPGQFAQAGAAGQHLQVVGTVSKLSGTVEVMHPDGTRSVVHEGDVIYKGDVIQTKDDGAVGITFADKSTFSLGKSGRMVIDELVYDPATQHGQSAMSVVKGTFSFVSGQIAKTSPEAATIKTPVMTIGIRGTTVAGTAAAEGENNTITLLADPDGGIGQIAVTNGAGTMTLNSLNQTLFVPSAFAVLPPPVVLSPGAVNDMYRNAINSNPAPVQHNVDPNQRPAAPEGGTAPAPAQQNNAPANDPTGGQDGNHGGRGSTETGNGGGDGKFLKTEIPTGNEVGIGSGPGPGGNNNGNGTIVIGHGDGNGGGGKNGGGGTTGTGTTGGGNTNRDDGNNGNNGNNGNTGNTGDTGSKTGDDTSATSGRAIDGYVRGALVFRDLDNDGEKDDGEAYTTTNSGGQYTLFGSGGVIVVRGGIDATTGHDLPFDMKAAGGSSVVTPLTTLVVAVAGQNATNASAISLAESKVKAMLGLDSSISLNSFDPIANFGTAAGKAVMTATAQTVATINALIVAFGSGVDAEDIISQIASVASGNGTLDLSSVAGLTSLITALNHGAPPSWASAVAGALSTSNSSLASAIANATSFASVEDNIASAISPVGELREAISNVANGSWDLSDITVIKAHLAVLKASGITTFSVDQGTATLSAAEAAGLEITVTSPAAVHVSDTGDNFATYATQLPTTCSSYVMTTNPANTLTPEQASALIGLVTKTGGYTLNVGGTTACDTLSLERLFSEGKDWQFDYVVRDGNNLKLVTSNALGIVNQVIIVNQFSGDAVEYITDGEEPLHLATGTDGTSGDDMFFTRDQGSTVTDWGANAENSGYDEFVYGGGKNRFHGDGDDHVTFAASTSAVTMTEALSNDGDGSATIDGNVQEFYGIREITGSQGNDTLYGRAAGSDYSYFWIEGGKGDDTIYDGGSGTTIVSYDRAKNGVTVNLALGTATGDGNDTLHDITKVAGSAFNDTLIGTTDDNWFEGGAGDDIITGDAGYDTVSYSDASAAVTVNLATGIVTGGAGNDTLSGIEAVRGSDYNDHLIGNDDNNSFSGGQGADTIEGGAGTDTVSYQSYGNNNPHGVIVNLSDSAHEGAAAHTARDNWGAVDVLTDIENIQGSEYGDVIYGSTAGNSIYGGDGNDIIYGGGGTDYINGGAGNDYLDGGTGPLSHVYGDAGNDTIVYRGGNYLNGGSGFDTLKFTANTNLNLGVGASYTMGFEVLDFTSAAVSLTATATQLGILTGTYTEAMVPGHTLYVLGGADDSITLERGWTAGVDTTYGGKLTHVWTKNGFTLYVQDGVAINELNQAPAFTSLTREIIANTATDLAASDADMDHVTYSVSDPAHGTVTGSTSWYTYVPDADFVGVDKFQVTATDSRGAATTQTVYTLSQGALPTLSLDAIGAPSFGNSTLGLLNATDWTHIDNIDLPSSSPEITKAYVYLSSGADGLLGSLRLGDSGAGGSLLELEGTVAEINAQLAQLHYKAPSTNGVATGNGDTVNVVLVRDDGVWKSSFDIGNWGPITRFTGANSNDSWEDSGNWSAGLPDTGDMTIIDGHEVTIGNASTVTAGALSIKDGSLDIAGTLDLTGYTVSLQTDAVSAFTLRSGATLNGGGGIVDLGGNSVIEGGTFNYGTLEISGGTAAITGAFTANDDLKVVDGILTIRADIQSDTYVGLWQLDGDVIVAGTTGDLTLDLSQVAIDGGTFTIDASGGNYTTDLSSGILNNNGTLVLTNKNASSSNHVDLIAGYGVINGTNGTINVEGGAATVVHNVEGYVQNQGTINVNQSLRVAGSMYNSHHLFISGSETLTLDGATTEATLTNDVDGLIKGSGTIDFIRVLDETEEFYRFDARLNNAGTIALDSDGDHTLAINGDVTLHDTSKLAFNVTDTYGDRIDFNTPGSAATKVNLNGKVVLNSNVTTAHNYELATKLVGMGDHFAFDQSSSAHNYAVFTNTNGTLSVHVDKVADGAQAHIAGADAIKTILGATGHVNVISDIGEGDVAYGGTLADSITVNDNAFILVDGQGGSNTLHLQEMADSTTSYDLNWGVKNFSTVVLDNTVDDRAIHVDIGLETALALNGGSTVSVQMYGSTDLADIVELSTNEGDWTVSMSADTRTIHATNPVDAENTASIDFSAVSGRGDHLFLSAQAGFGLTVSGQYYDSGTISYMSSEGADYVFGADQNRHDIRDIGWGDYIFGGSEDDSFQAKDIFGTVAGGAGDDLLTLERGSDLVNYNLIGRLSGVETITLHGTPSTVVDGIETPSYESAITLRLSDAEVSSASGSAIRIFGDTNTDNIILEGSWSASGANSYTSSSGATVTVDDGSHVTLAPTLPPGTD